MMAEAWCAALPASSHDDGLRLRTPGTSPKRPAKAAHAPRRRIHPFVDRRLERRAGKNHMSAGEQNTQNINLPS
jgi:hypothetical protein